MSIRRRLLPLETWPTSIGSYDPVEGCREAMTLRPVGCFRLEGPKCFLDGGGGEFTTLGVGGQGSR